MRNSASLLHSLVFITALGCASSPPPEAATVEPTPSEPAPPAPPPPAPEPPPPEPVAAAPAEPARAPAPATMEEPATPARPAPRPRASSRHRSTPATTQAPPPAAEPRPAPAPAPSAAPATAGYTGPNPCKLATKGDSPVAQACRDGGAKAAKSAMKQLVAKAKANGEKFRCDDCHKDPQDDTKLAGDAQEKFKKLLAAAK